MILKWLSGLETAPPIGDVLETASGCLAGPWRGNVDGMGSDDLHHTNQGGNAEGEDVVLINACAVCTSSMAYRLSDSLGALKVDMFHFYVEYSHLHALQS